MLQKQHPLHTYSHTYITLHTYIHTQATTINLKQHVIGLVRSRVWLHLRQIVFQDRGSSTL